MAENRELHEPNSFDYTEVMEIMKKLEQGSLKPTVDQNQQDIQNDSVTDEEICKIVQQIEESVKKDKEKEAEKVQSPDIHTIERHVKTMKRDIKGTTKDDTFIYNTLKELKKKEKKKSTKQEKQPHNLVIDGVDCTKKTWKNLDSKTTSKIKLFFDNVNDNEVSFWEDQDMMLVNRGDLKIIIEEQMLEQAIIDIHTEFIAGDLEEKNMSNQYIFGTTASVIKDVFYLK
ncbi:hypothetical protein M0R45_025959 [Rubus argutus]|uniref:Uncharacterized protein n=1 Tax=Rubus argutus TaxID=59490 RepID=A0AAW1WVP1_RUBAR